MFIRILVLALCCSLVSCKNLVDKYKRSNSGVSSGNRQLLFDFRAMGESSLSAEAIEKIRRHPFECRVASYPKLTSVAKGSFTYAAENETAYLVSNVCGTANELLVYSGDKLQASSPTAYTHIVATFDLNRDDKNELLLVGENTHNGEISREASLDTFERNSLRAVEDLGIVYHDSCALFAGADEAKKKTLIASGLTPYVEAVVVYYLPHSGPEMPSFTAERYRAPCPTPPNTALGHWQIVSR